MSETKRCPQCQTEIPAGAAEALCPRCLLQAGLGASSSAEPRTEPYTPRSSTFEPPTPAQLQAAFPNLEILELLGRGGMGAVYKARQANLDRFVAVKILPPEISQDPTFVERFTREARALAKLNHANIISVFDFGQAGGYCYFLMEYVDGVNLRQAIRGGGLSPAEAIKIVPQICDALQFAHDEGVVHRDIKPENILLDRKGRVKIADFGLAKLLGKAGSNLALTGTRDVMGTLHYMAPEQMQGTRDVDHRADIFSLGVTFYEMLTGELPIGRFAPPSRKVQVDVRLDEVVLRSLEREPEQRYQHASEIKSEVESIRTQPVTQASAPVTEEHPLLKGTRWMSTPQPEYARFVGIPTLVLTAIVVVAGPLGMIFLPEWAGCMIVGVGFITLAGVFLVLNLAWAARRSSRPWMVPLLGGINVLLAIAGTALAAAGLMVDEEIPAQIAGRPILRQLYDIWWITDSIVGYVFGAVSFISGIGLMLWLRWGRRLTVLTAWVGLVYLFLTIAPMVAFVFYPAMADAPNVAPGEMEQFFFQAGMIGSFAILTLITFAYEIAILFYLTRPHIIAAFEKNE